MKLLTLKPRKPIIIPPGMISMVFLPVLCYSFIFKPMMFSGRNKIEVYMVDSDNGKISSGKKRVYTPPLRDYLHINLNGNEADDKTRLDFAKLEIRNILQTRDTVKGVNFHFSNKAKYWTYVTALDICQTENAEIYIPYRDDLYVLYATPKPTINTFICGNQFRWDNYRSEAYPDNVLTLSAVVTELKSFWAPAVIFIMMLFFTFRNYYLNTYR